jgi:hypothetical protein
MADTMSIGDALALSMYVSAQDNKPLPPKTFDKVTAAEVACAKHLNLPDVSTARR